MLILNMILMVLIDMVYIKDTNTKYDANGFDINSKHKDTGIFLINKKNINWLKDKDGFLKSYNEIIKDENISVNISKK